MNQISCPNVFHPPLPLTSPPCLPNLLFKHKMTKKAARPAHLPLYNPQSSSSSSNTNQNDNEEEEEEETKSNKNKKERRIGAKNGGSYQVNARRRTIKFGFPPPPPILQNYQTSDLINLQAFLEPLFDKRPAWHRNALTIIAKDRHDIFVNRIRDVMFSMGYANSSGPWRRTIMICSFSPLLPTIDTQDGDNDELKDEEDVTKFPFYHSLLLQAYNFRLRYEKFKIIYQRLMRAILINEGNRQAWESLEKKRQEEGEEEKATKGKHRDKIGVGGEVGDGYYVVNLDQMKVIRVLKGVIPLEISNTEMADPIMVKRFISYFCCFFL